MIRTLSLAPSSNIAGGSYDDAERDLVVTFHDGRSYRHSGVPAEVAAAWQQSPSAGQFYNRQIKGRYAYEEV